LLNRARFSEEESVPEIHVVFPKSGKPSVVQPAEVATRGEPITWVVYSTNPKIRSVEVEFHDPEAKFFSNTSTQTKRRVAVKGGQVDFYGHVPHYPKLSEPKIAKYTVRAFSKVKGGKKVAEIDPVIITSKP
jgi:hypothetical protein